MPRLTWDNVGQRFYELGLDRGVLYIPSQPGVAWSGLISVSESPNGGDARPYYIDGVKYLNLSSAEEFEATINAYSSPPEFWPCDGTVSIHNGLYATQQRRQSFSLAYRTKLGNDAVGNDFAYKIHLVYNALAAPAQRTNSTISDSSDAATFSWNITTLPPMSYTFKPTSHFIIDSRYTAPEVLSEVEDILYGTDAVAAALPTPYELSLLFAP